MLLNNIRKLNFLYFSVILIALDIILHIVFNDVNFNYLHVIFFDIAIGILFSLLVKISKGIIKNIVLIIMNIIILLYSFLVLIQIFLKINYDTTYPIKTISSNISNVINQYNDEIIDIVQKHFLLIILFIISIILFLIISRIIYIYDAKQNIKSFIVLSFVLILTSIVSLLTVNKNISSWGDNLKINGLKTAIILDLNENTMNYVDFLEMDINNYLMNEYSKIEYDNNILLDTENDSEKYNIHSDFELDEYNIMDYDFDTLNSTETRIDYLRTNNYIKSLPATKKNKLTGLFKGKNLIMICAEAWNSIIVDEKLFPTMYRLINNGFRFNNFYQPHSSSSTSSGEYAFLTGMVSVEDDYSFRDSIENNMGFSISSKLHDIGYKTYSFHNGVSTYYNRDETHGKLMNFDEFFANDTGLFSILHKQWPDDKELFDSTFDVLSKKQPFMAYYMTYSAHMPYDGKESDFYLDYKDKIEGLYGNTKSMVYKNYVAKNLVLEEALTNLIDNLDKNDMLNDTVICMVPDHYPYGLYRSNQFTHTKDNYVAELYNDKNIDDDKIKRDKTDIIFWCGSLENEDKDKVLVIDKPTCTIDITPTLLNLFGIEFDSRIYPGHDMFSSMEGLVIYQDGRFVTKDYICQDGYEEVPKEYLIYKNKVINANNYCKFNIKNDYYGYLVGKTGEIKKICYLMFEGGPTDNTIKILDILDEAKVKATFFVCDKQKLEYLKLISNKDHKLGICIDNLDLLSNNKIDTFADSLNKLFSKILEVTKEKAYYVHFSKEAVDLIEKDNDLILLSQITSQLSKLTLNVVKENIDSKDLTVPITKNEIIQNVLSMADNKDHIFVLLHDYDNTGLTVDALPQIIDGLKHKGYRFKFMDQITKIIN